MSASMGGLRSEDRSFRAACTAANWISGSGLDALATICSKPANERPLSASSSSIGFEIHDYVILNEWIRHDVK
jgi:hypothetical protein